MENLLSKKVQRGNYEDESKTLREWQSSSAQSTLDGLNAFKARQEARRLAAQSARPVDKVRTLKAAK